VTKMENEIVPLTSLSKGEKGIVVSITGGLNATKRLADMGIVPNTEITISAKAPICGPLEVVVRGSKLSIGWGLASKILVRKVKE
jgi:ferrous iron transport protein A